jgi:hypothetical protein
LEGQIQRAEELLATARARNGAIKTLADAIDSDNNEPGPIADAMLKCEALGFTIDHPTMDTALGSIKDAIEAAIIEGSNDLLGQLIPVLLKFAPDDDLIEKALTAKRAIDGLKEAAAKGEDSKKKRKHMKRHIERCRDAGVGEEFLKHYYTDASILGGMDAFDAKAYVNEMFGDLLVQEAIKQVTLQKNDADRMTDVSWMDECRKTCAKLSASPKWKPPAIMIKTIKEGNEVEEKYEPANSASCLRECPNKCKEACEDTRYMPAAKQEECKRTCH